MLDNLCIRMPFLHPELSDAPIEAYELPFREIKYFHPGHAPLPQDSKWYQPDNLPVSSMEAASIMLFLRNQNLPELERVQLLMRQRLHEKDRRYRSEMKDLESFVNEDTNAPSWSQPLKQAQINLFWLWRQEEEYLEISSLAHMCGEAERDLLKAVQDLSEKPDRNSEPAIAVASELLPDWKKIFLNSAFFIDPEIPILIEGSMKTSLQENFIFEPYREYENLMHMELPLWKILELSEKDVFNDVDFWNGSRHLFAIKS